MVWSGMVQALGSSLIGFFSLPSLRISVSGPSEPFDSPKSYTALSPLLNFGRPTFDTSRFIVLSTKEDMESKKARMQILDQRWQLGTDLRPFVTLVHEALSVNSGAFFRILQVTMFV